VILVSLLAASVSGASGPYRYHPQYHVPPSLESVLRQLRPGQDAFPAEKEAEELGHRLGELSALLRAHAGLVPEAADGLLAPDFRLMLMAAPPMKPEVASKVAPCTLNSSTTPGGGA